MVPCRIGCAGPRNSAATIAADRLPLGHPTVTYPPQQCCLTAAEVCHLCPALAHLVVSYPAVRVSSSYSNAIVKNAYVIRDLSKSIVCKCKDCRPFYDKLFKIKFEDDDREEWDFEELKMNLVMSTDHGDDVNTQGSICTWMTGITVTMATSPQACRQPSPCRQGPGMKNGLCHDSDFPSGKAEDQGWEFILNKLSEL
jgi:hypothetical protein